MIVGPLGYNFVAIPLDEAWHKFLATPYLANGSDQRADWMANLLMFVPMGFLMSGLWKSRGGMASRLVAGLLAFATSLSVVLAIKFAQLYFPGRTVSLNYILAQSIGAGIGVIGFLISQRLNFSKAHWANWRRTLLYLLVIYAAAYVVLSLMPMDLVISPEDWRMRLHVVPHLLLSLPAAGRSSLIRLALILANMCAAAPIGLLLATIYPGRGNAWYLGLGVSLMTVLVVLKLFIMSATPYLAAIFYNTVGVMIGVSIGRLASVSVMLSIRDQIRRNAAILGAAYLLCLLYVNGLISPHWRTLSEAFEAVRDTRGLLPFWHWYIVSKAQALESQIVHAAMFIPLGFLLSVRRNPSAKDGWFAAGLALLLAEAVEIGRWFKPGFYPDFYEGVTAALAAWVTLELMRYVWRVCENSEDINSATAADDQPRRLFGPPVADRTLQD